MRKTMPNAYWRERLRVAKAEYEELDRQIRQELKPLATWSTNKCREMEQLLLPKTKRIAQLRREISECKNALPD